MNFLTTLFALLAGVLAVSAGWTDAQLCQRNRPGLVEAIQKFCGRWNLDVPTQYARNGAASSGVNRGWSVAIEGDCQPKQWVPPQYCFSQFYSMCAQNAPGRGDVYVRRFGKMQCQTWVMRGFSWQTKRDEEGVAQMEAPAEEGEETAVKDGRPVILGELPGVDEQ